MTVQPELRRIEDCWRAFVPLLIEQGLVAENGQITRLGEQYLDAMREDATSGGSQSPIAPPPIDPNFLKGGASGGRSWSELPDF